MGWYSIAICFIYLFGISIIWRVYTRIMEPVPIRLLYLWDFGAVPLLEPSLGLLVGVVLFAGVVVGEVGISRWTFRRCRWSWSCRCSSCSCCSSCCRSCSCCSRCGCGCGGSCSSGFLLWEMDCNLNVAQSFLFCFFKLFPAPDKCCGERKRKEGKGNFC